MTWYTPNATVKEALFSIRWSYAIGLFVLPCALVGVQEFGGIEGAFFGGIYGFSFVGFILFLQWFMGPI